MVSTTILRSFSRLLTYPAGPGLDAVRASLREIAEEQPALQRSLGGLFEFVEEHVEAELEEVFTRTFDSNAERALEVGWHIHGENYARGVFMARMRSLLREHGIEESSELPDHLSHVLLVVAEADPKLASALSNGVLLQALTKIIDGFASDENPYRGVLVGLKDLLEEDGSDE